jgi:hypothetical protein
MGPDDAVCLIFPKWKYNQLSLTYHPCLGWGLMRRHLETSWRDAAGPDYFLIYCLFTLETLRNNGRSMVTISPHPPKYPQPAHSQWPHINPQTQIFEHTRFSACHLLNWEFPSLLEIWGLPCSQDW